MSPVKVIEKFLLKECVSKGESGKYDSCIVCASSVVWRISSLFPESYVVANGAAQVFPNLATIYYAVRELKVPLVAIVGSTSVELEHFIEIHLQSAEFEFKLLRKTYEENAEILLTMYEDRKLFNAALMELNIDSQIEKLLSLSEFSEPVKRGELAVCGLVLDEALVYGDRVGFYLINCNGIKDPEEIRSSELLSQIPEAVRKQKIKRLHLQF
jgi:carbonic anhydrase